MKDVMDGYLLVINFHVVAWVRVYYYIILSSILNLRSSEIHLFYNLQDFYWHFLEILWLFIFLFLYSY